MSIGAIATEASVSNSCIHYCMKKLDVERRAEEDATRTAVAQDNQIPEEKLRRDVRRVARNLDKRPTRAEYNVHGAYHSDTVRRRIGNGSWFSALEAIGV